MISTEVQRTLVKSPPELWAELSDPQALARHLGELGEIRITRVQPEETVEWEAGSTSGTITIKPSGWGTKVTLSATHEPAAGGVAEAEAPESSEPEPAPVDVTTAERFAPQHPEPLLHDTLAAAVTDPGEQSAAPGQPPAPAAPQQAATPEQPAYDEALPQPGTPQAAETARQPEEAREEPAPEPEEAPVSETEPAHIPEAAAPPPAEPETPLEDQVLAAEEFDLAPGESRRGFFSRLLERFRGPRETQGQDRWVEIYEVDVERLTDGAVRPPSEGETYAGRSREPAGDRAVDDAGTGSSDLTFAAPEQAAPQVETPAAEEQPAEAPEPPAAPSAVEASPVEPATPPAIQSAGDSTAIAPAPETAEPTETAASGLGAELRAAEEAGEDHVEAVLTATLDRLGAAHHRPFSRA
jgi:hypothetical protein